MKVKIMKWAVAFAVLGAVTIYLGCGDDDDNGPTPTKHGKTGWCSRFPMDKGNKWVYDYKYTDYAGHLNTGEYTYEITSSLGYYHGFEAYLITITQAGVPFVDYKVIGCDGVNFYSFSGTYWYYVVSDAMQLNDWNESGFFVWLPLQFTEIKEVVVPAGTFADCYKLSGVFNTVAYEEYYAANVGVTYYRYGTTGSYWYSTEYSLKSYEIHHEEEE